MASYLYRTRGVLQFPRYIPTLMSRAQASQNNPTTSASSQGASTSSGAKTGGTNQNTSSVLPKSTTSSDKTNPTKTSSDAPPLDHDTVDIKNKSTGSSSKSSSSSGSGSNQQQSFLNSTAGKVGSVVLLTVAIYAGYKMISGGGSGGNTDLKHNEHYKRATADYQPANTQGTDVKK